MYNRYENTLKTETVYYTYKWYKLNTGAATINYSPNTGEAATREFLKSYSNLLMDYQNSYQLINNQLIVTPLAQIICKYMLQEHLYDPWPPLDNISPSSN